MSKISPNVIKNICSVPNVTNMFIEFDKYQDYFSEGKKEEYLKEIKNYIYDTFYKKLYSSDFIMEKDFISCSIKLFDEFFINEETILNERIFHYLNSYKKMVNMCVERRVGPCSLENKDLRNQALEVANTQLNQIDDYFKNHKYEKKVLEALSEFDQFLPYEKLSKEDYKKLNNIIANVGTSIPSRYVNLYFSNTITNNQKPTFLGVNNALESIITNYAEEKGTHCYFEARKIDYKTLGIYFDNIIRLNDSLIKKFVNNPKENAEDLFMTLFHEIRHLAQEQSYKGNREFSYTEIKMLKDDLLHRCLKSKYKKDNYLNLSFELDAREESRIQARRYLWSIGASVKYSSHEYEVKDRKKHDTDLRIIDVKMVPVDHLFTEFMPNIISICEGDYAFNVFEEYPILKLMYDETGRRYTSLELFKKREELKKQNLLKPSRQLEIDIHNLNQIIYNQDLSFVNLVADYKEMLTDNELEIDVEEKANYLTENLYHRINNRSATKFRYLSYFLCTLLKRNIRDVSDGIKFTIQNGKEITENLTKLMEQILVSEAENMIEKSHTIKKK